MPAATCLPPSEVASAERACWQNCRQPAGEAVPETLESPLRMNVLSIGRARSRWVYAAAFAGTIAVGLASRRVPRTLPSLVSKYPGDALWALMVFFGLGALFRTAATLHLAAGALGLAVTVELLKLYQAPWIVAVRHTTLGHLVFGHVFSWENLAAYAVGVTVGALIDQRLAARA